MKMWNATCRGRCEFVAQGGTIGDVSTAARHSLYINQTESRDHSKSCPSTPAGFIEGC